MIPNSTDISLDPVGAQARVLENLVAGYAKTDYARDVEIQDFREKISPATYQDLLPYLERVKRGEWRALLSEPPVEWAMTRGTTGKRKVIPLTLEEVKTRLRCAPRGVFSWIARTGQSEVLDGYVLNLGYSSSLKGEKMGHSSGIYSRYGSNWGRMVPDQGEIDSLAEKASEERFSLIWDRAQDKKITMCCGVTQQMIKFGSWLRRKRHTLPAKVWDVKLLACTSVAHIHDRYSYPLRAMYGRHVNIIEMYGATEGMYGQQMDSRRGIVPNYDSYLFEVQLSGGKRKMLHELKRGERGRLIISSHVLPRYIIGDVIQCLGVNEGGYGKYFRVWRERGGWGLKSSTARSP